MLTSSGDRARPFRSSARGYETFDYSSNTLKGRLKGDGWTAGGYLGWRIWPGLRFDAALAR